MEGMKTILMVKVEMLQAGVEEGAAVNLLPIHYILPKV